MPMYGVQTDHQILAFGDHIMQLVTRDTGEVIVLAERDEASGTWTVSVPDSTTIPDVTAPTVNGSEQPRSEAITAMVNQALAVLPNDGYSTLVPHGLPETP